MAAILDLGDHFDFKKPASRGVFKYTRVSKKITDHCVITFSYIMMYIYEILLIYAANIPALLHLKFDIL